MPDAPARRPPHIAVRILTALSVLAAVGAYLAAQVDFVRRHTLGFPQQDPLHYYWIPQLTHIWAPLLGVALLLGFTAFLLHRARRPDVASPPPSPSPTLPASPK
jgi:hypothetical protein